jgi:peptidoglycan/xylan/chitin deacetylase (PgdA/CDA1 family)
MVVKVLALFAIVLELVYVPPGARALAVTATVLATAGFFAYVIVAPWSQFLVRSVCRLPQRDRVVAFTFDDGPDPVTTPQVLDLLARHGAKATFFVVGSRAAAHPELVRRIVAEGHAVGSHTYDHAHTFHFGAPGRQRAEVERGIAAVAAVTGKPPTLFRPPQGLRTPLLRDALRPLHDLVCVTWTERGLDAMGRQAGQIVRRLEPAVQPSAILTLHDGAGLGGTNDRRPTVEALGRLLELAAARNLRCVSLAALEGTT